MFFLDQGDLTDQIDFPFLMLWKVIDSFSLYFILGVDQRFQAWLVELSQEISNILTSDWIQVRRAGSEEESHERFTGFEQALEEANVPANQHSQVNEKF